MRTWFLPPRTLRGLTGLLLVNALSGMVPEEAKARTQQPVPAAGGQANRTSRAGTPQRGPNLAPARVSRLYFYPGTRTLVPPAWARCTVMPGLGYWQQRDLMGEIKWMSRSGFIPVSPIGTAVDALSDYAQYPAGWRAYGLAVPAGGTVQVEVQHPKLGWFRLLMVDKWGAPGPGMQQQLVTHQPVRLTYKNPGKEATAVYIIVDDPGWWSSSVDPYTLLVRRDWDPARTDLSQVPMVAGLWGASPSVSAQFRGPSLTGPAVFPR